MKALLIPMFVLSVVACAATGSVQKVPMPDPTAASIGPDRARVYMFRDDQAFGQSWHLLVSNSVEEIGELAPGDYLCFDASPGLAQYFLVLDRGLIAGKPIKAALSQRLEGGQTYYGSVSFGKDSASVDVKLDFLPESAGRERIAALKPAPVAQ